MALRKKHLWWLILALLVAAIIAVHLYLDIWLKDYVNRVLSDLNGYEGSAESIDVAFYRGAYTIHHLKLYKKNGNIPVPFLSVETVDFSVQWTALFHGRIVSNADLEKPILNFAIAPNGNAKQNGMGVDWTKPIKDLMPIDINHVTFRNGMLTYRDFSTTPKVDVYIHRMSGEVRNLRNVVDKTHPLPSTLEVDGDSIGGGRLSITGRLNILKEVPDMKLAAKLENVNLKALTDYSNAYASVDIRGGTLDVYSELNVKDNEVSGYVKPLAKGVKLIDLHKSANPIKLAWETIVTGIVEIFTNHSHDQFATKIPLSGRLDNVHTQMLPALGGIIRNAFIEAFKPTFDKNQAHP